MISPDTQRRFYPGWKMRKCASCRSGVPVESFVVAAVRHAERSGRQGEVLLIESQ